MIKAINTLTIAALTITPAIAENSYKKDREAILKMAGEFKVEFYFKETVALKSGYNLKPDAYKAVAKEKVIVISDSKDSIELQHLLMVEGHVIKHWSQIWTYEDTELLEFQGHNTWKLRSIPKEAVKGTWTQLVTQTTDAPRYESIGTWNHEADSSTWTSGETFRPLPRREYKKRKDYDVIVATNRQTISPEGWIHEQDNKKLVHREGLSEPLCREVGFNTYQRITDTDFTSVDEFWDKNSPFWIATKKAWSQVLDGKQEFTLLKHTDDGSIRFMLNEKEEESITDSNEIADALAPYFTEVH
ncbi:DUF6607 family protein [Rubritalea spongiae]|uniref:DUF6607 family protein n=1 Tax=Rubritalea spongiae TaxID=430797 RepID=A0ABW5EAB8_9BACT